MTVVSATHIMPIPAPFNTVVQTTSAALTWWFQPVIQRLDTPTAPRPARMRYLPATRFANTPARNIAIPVPMPRADSTQPAASTG